MARAGMARWRGKNPGPAEGDEVQRSLELLDKVLSEFDDLENGNVAEAAVVVSPEDGSGSLGGHQSEDDGYMSMNGRRAKFVLSFRPVQDEGPTLQLPPAPEPPPNPLPIDMADFPPPPEEAQRIISTLLPRVSPGNSTKRSGIRTLFSTFSTDAEEHRVTASTQTTLPKTRHQRPFGWETGCHLPPFHMQPPSYLQKFASLPYDSALQLANYPPPWLPPRTVPGAMERHREVRRQGSGEGDGCGGEEPCPPLRTLNELMDDDHANFSDDSLEELLPPPPCASKRNSIAWEVSLDEIEAGSTKVVGRRRRRSGDHSSSSSIHKLRDQEEWPDPPPEETLSPSGDPDLDDCPYLLAGVNGSQITPSGTYVIRKGRKKERKPIATVEPILNPKLADLKRCSSTFDNIKSLLKEGLLEGLDDAPPDFPPPTPPSLVRVVSLPTLASQETQTSDRLDFASVPRQISRDRSKTDIHRISRPHELAVTMEEEEDFNFCLTDSFSEHRLELNVSEEEMKLIAKLQRETSGQFLDTSAESLLLSDREDLLGQMVPDRQSSNEDVFGDNLRSRQTLSERQNSMEDVFRDNSRPRQTLSNRQSSMEDMFRDNSRPRQALSNRQSSMEDMFMDNPRPRPKDLPTRPELEDPWLRATAEGMDFPPLPPSPVEEDEDEYSEILHTPGGRADTLPEPFYRCLEPCPPEPPPHGEPLSSLKTRSMDAGFGKNHRNSRRNVPCERRTLPSELPGPLKRRTFHKRQSPQGETLQTSCSLPETPIFARGCDIPRTPHRRAPEIPGGARTAPRPGGLATANYHRHGTGTSLGSGGLGQAIVGAELLMLAGGPGRGWYPRHRQQTRPASIEHLDRLAPGHSPGHMAPWDARDSRKPLTLPPNLSPKFFHRSPREALRRVTSLLIRKGSPKEPKKDILSPAGHGSECSGEGSRQKRGFFKSFWKRSRHYSLEHQ